MVGRDKSGARDEHIHTTIHKIDSQPQYSVITYMGKESEKEWTYVYV